MHTLRQGTHQPGPLRGIRAVAEATDRFMPENLAEGTLLSLAKVVEQRDCQTAGHCERLAFTGVALGVSLGLDTRSLLTLYLGGYLHDIGKVGISDAILFKPGRLTDEEWQTMKSHPLRGEEICRPLPSFRHVLPLIRSHHERMDGTGYPDHLAGDDVPFLARVLQVVDIYDALTNARAYKQAYSHKQALEILEEEADKGWRDPAVTSRFIQMNKRVLNRVRAYSNHEPASCMQDSLTHLQHFLAS